MVAGAGTGKTRVITERIRNLLESDPELAGENILGLTFTDKAAGEMKYRVVKTLGERAEGVWLSTFHTFCLEKILQAVNPDIQPLDDIDHRILLRRNMRDLGLMHFKRLPEPGEFLNDFVRFFSRCQDELVTPDDYQRYVDQWRTKHERRSHALEPDARWIAEEELARQEELARVYRVSERLLRERNLYTFGAQLLQAVELLRTDAALLERMREQYRYILVDEFQDTNIAQLELLWLLAGRHGNIMAVGDHNQAIYRFRGASYGSFTIFLERFCGVGEPNPGPGTRKFLVSLSAELPLDKAHSERGRRSDRTQRTISAAAAQLTANGKSRRRKDPSRGIRATRRGSALGRVGNRAPARCRRAWRSFAVLYRKHTHRAQLLDALRRRRIPFVIRKFSILSSTLVRDLLA